MKAAQIRDEEPLELLAGYGVELEYMIVDAETLDVGPIADSLLTEAGLREEMEVARGDLCWSGELALHVLELKTNGPVSRLTSLPSVFDEHVGAINRRLSRRGARLLPGAMHPWMDPTRELTLWPHELTEVFAALDRIFDCRGHGWANLQSAHLNLSFSGAEQFGRLHAAIRVVLPLIPALAASSPICEGRATGMLDTRLSVYRDNARRIPSVTGLVVPERVYTPEAYQQLLGAIYADLAPHDPQGLLQHEWINGRGCIARFDRSAIEIRLLDVQECPEADLAVAAALVALVRALVDERFATRSTQQKLDERQLAALLEQTLIKGDRALIEDGAYLAVFGRNAPCRAGELWQELVAETFASAEARWLPALELIFQRGVLARRILEALDVAPGTRAAIDRGRLHGVYRQLADCLAAGRMFEPR